MRSTDTRTRLIDAMALALQRRGLHGVGLNELLADADAPKGVLYHHFPGGKTELAVVAIESMTVAMTARLDRLLADGVDPITALRGWIAKAERVLASSDFERGCPLGSVGLESGAQDVAIRQALTAAFAAIRDRVAALLGSAGVEAARANGLAALVVACYEGGLMQSRVAGSLEPMRSASESLLAMLDTMVRHDN